MLGVDVFKEIYSFPATLAGYVYLDDGERMAEMTAAFAKNSVYMVRPREKTNRGVYNLPHGELRQPADAPIP